MRLRQRQRLLRIAAVPALVGLLADNALAMDFELGDGWTGNWTSSISYSSAWRTKDPDSRLYGAANGALVGLPNGTGSGTTDEGNLNYRKGDQYTSLLKLVSEVDLKKGEMGGFIRIKAWNDFALQNDPVRLGSKNNGYNGYNATSKTLGPARPLSDSGFEPLARFDGIHLLDAYAYNTFDLAGNPLQVKVGNQVVNWGESIFIQGLNQISPIDVPAVHKPGAQLKEVFLPVPTVRAIQSLGNAGNIDAFWQWQWKDTPLDMGCGNYWAVAQGTISANPGSCNLTTSLVGSNPSAVANGLYVPIIQGKKARDSGEYGLSYHFTSTALDTEFGAYAMNLHSRTPIVSGQLAKTAGQFGFSPLATFWEYPEDQKIFGLSATTSIAGWSVAAELSETHDLPVQIDGNDLLHASLAAAGAIVPGVSLPLGPAGGRAIAASLGNGYVSGYTRANKTQLLVNTLKVGNGVLGAAQYLLLAEAGFQWNNLPDYKTTPNAFRYGRAFIFGPGSHPSYGVIGAANTCGTPLNPSPQGCINEGYVTPFAWGYRLKAELTYNDVFGTGVVAFPNIFWSHDVRGVSADGQFLQDRQALGLGVRFSYAKKYTLELNAVRFNPRATYDPLRDRDTYSATLGVNF